MLVYFAHKGSQNGVLLDKVLRLSSNVFWLCVFLLFDVILKISHFGHFCVVAIWAAIKVAIDVGILAGIEPSFAYDSIFITEVAAVVNIAIKRWPLPWFSPVNELIALVT